MSRNRVLDGAGAGFRKGPLKGGAPKILTLDFPLCEIDPEACELDGCD